MSAGAGLAAGVGIGICLAGDTLLPAPVTPVPALLDAAQVDRGVAALDAIVADAMRKTGVPGVAVGVVYRDGVVYAEGRGVRETGKPESIDPDTVFLLASVSKPIASTVIAALVGRKLFGWDDAIKPINPAFALSDPYVTAHATFADMLSHRSGLSTGAGDLLEDLGYDRGYILSHLDQQPLAPFRSTYRYSNFGYTAGAIAAAVAAGKPWEDLADEVLFLPAGMTSASYRHADYLAQANRARIHQRIADGSWAARYDRQPDAEAPAGGASASLNDMLRFVRLQLGHGTLDGQPIIDTDALAATHEPRVISNAPHSPADRAGFYGLGWNVSYDDQGRSRVSHSGAFALGTGTNVTLLPGEDLGIVVLTNGQPVGLAEAIGLAFLDAAEYGRQRVDWLGFVGGIYAQMEAAEAPAVDYRRKPKSPAPARQAHAYVGTYGNGYYGPLQVIAAADGLAMTLGPPDAPLQFALTHFDGDIFSFDTFGENANGLAGAIFTIGDNGSAAKVVLDFYDKTGLGTFVRE